VNFPADSSEHEFIARLWGTRRVGYLMDQIRLHGENPELRDEVTELARKYGIVTPYTAYLIMEDERHRGVAQNVQSLPAFAMDAPAQQEAAKMYSGLKDGREGDRAIFQSRSSARLRMADTSAGAIQNGASEAVQSLGVAMPPPGVAGNVPVAAPAPVARVVQYAQETRFVGGRNFFQNNGQWIDPAVQKIPNAKRLRIQFASPEYYKLVKEHPETAPWLALGPNVQFVLAGEVCEIFDKAESNQ
jgi:Ca-activated chloride channel homolog